MPKLMILVLATLLVGVPATAMSLAKSADPSISKMVDPFVSETIAIDGVVVSVEFTDLSTGFTLMTSSPALIAMADFYAAADGDTNTARFTKEVSDGNGGKKKVEMTVTVTKRPDESGKETLKRFEKRCEDAIASGWEPVVTKTSEMYIPGEPLFVVDVTNIGSRANSMIGVENDLISVGS